MSFSSHYKTPRAEDEFLQRFTQLLATICINQWIYKRVANDENQKKVEMAEKTLAVRVFGARKYQDEMKKKGTPANDEHPQ